MKTFSHLDNFHLCCLAQYPNLTEATKQLHVAALSADARPVGEAIIRKDKNDEDAKHYLEWVEYNWACGRRRKAKKG